MKISTLICIILSGFASANAHVCDETLRLSQVGVEMRTILLAPARALTGREIMQRLSQAGANNRVEIGYHAASTAWQARVQLQATGLPADVQAFTQEIQSIGTVRTTLTRMRTDLASDPEGDRSLRPHVGRSLNLPFKSHAGRFAGENVGKVELSFSIRDASQDLLPLIIGRAIHHQVSVEVAPKQSALGTVSGATIVVVGESIRLEKYADDLRIHGTVRSYPVP